jgi:protease-4
VVRIEGEITDFQPTALILHQARSDPRVRAVLLYLNSPGGLAHACLELAKCVGECAEVKPIIAVMGSEAASGAYFIASFASYIYTHENTITGGIGVLAVWVDLTQYYNKSGIKIWVWTTGKEKDFGAEWRSPTSDEQAQIQNEVNELFRLIVQAIKRNRNLSEAALEEISTGRVFLGGRAVDLGLADEVGDIIDAEKKAQRLAGIWRYVVVTPELDSFSRFLKALL